MPNNDYYYQIGCLVSNLQAVETAARLALVVNESSFSSAKDIYDYVSKLKKASVGDELPADHYTKYTTLEKVVDAFNLISNEKLDIGLLVEVRDLIAHGRVQNFGLDNQYDSSAVIYKFTDHKKSRNGKVTITHKQAATNDWVSLQADKVNLEFQKVMKKLSEIYSLKGIHSLDVTEAERDAIY